MPARDRPSEVYGVVESGHPVSYFGGRSSGVYNGDMPLDCHELTKRNSINALWQLPIDFLEHFPDAEVEGLGFIHTGIAGHEPDQLGSPSTPHITYCGNASDPKEAGAGQLRAIFARLAICTSSPRRARWSERS
jgi:hypothetical protein